MHATGALRWSKIIIVTSQISSVVAVFVCFQLSINCKSLFCRADMFLNMER